MVMLKLNERDRKRLLRGGVMISSRRVELPVSLDAQLQIGAVVREAGDAGIKIERVNLVYGR